MCEYISMRNCEIAKSLWCETLMIKKLKLWYHDALYDSIKCNDVMMQIWTYNNVKIWYCEFVIMWNCKVAPLW